MTEAFHQQRWSLWVPTSSPTSRVSHERQRRSSLRLLPVYERATRTLGTPSP